MPAAENKLIEKSYLYTNLPVSSKIFAIDIGTSSVRVAIFENEKPAVVQNFNGQSLIPSVLAFSNRDGWIVGSKAVIQGLTDPKNSFPAVSRLLGASYSESVARRAFLNFDILPDKNDNIKIACPATGKNFTPEQLLAQMLSGIIESIGFRQQKQINKIVITCPAAAQTKYLHKINEACKLAGLTLYRIVSNTSAAAMAYSLNKTEEQTIAVFDFGGGSFDISVLEIGGGVVEVTSASGDTHLGGRDIDEILIKWIIEEFKKSSGIDLAFNETALARLKEAAEKAKIELSSAPETEINVPFITADASGAKHLVLKLTRAEFETLVEPILKRIMMLVAEVVKDAGLNKNEIDQIILVGGSTRIPKVRQTVKNFFGKEPNKTLNPDEAVAIGAAVQASILEGNKTDLLLLDAVPHSLGIETSGGVMSPIIARNTSIPTRKSEIFTASFDSQTHFVIHILEGETKAASGNESLAVLLLNIPQPSLPGKPRVEVTFDVATQGIISIFAKELESGEEKKVLINKKSLSQLEEDLKLLADKNCLPAELKTEKENNKSNE